MTRILAFSDTHGSHHAAASLCAESARADLVIGAGDFCTMRRGLAEAMAALSGIAAPFVLVPGNAESAAELRAAAPAGAVVLHGEGTELAGLRLFGLGYGVPVTPFGAWSCDLDEAQARDLLAPCAQADILVTHSPPKGIADVTSSGQSIGSIAIRDAILRIGPRLVLCGHVHDSWGGSGRLGASEVHNLGPSVTWFEV